MRGDEIELFAQIWQRSLRIDSRDDAVNAKKIGRAAKERFVIGIEPETFVAEEPAEVEEITRAAAKIQDVERRRPIEPEVLDALYVHADPIVRVLVGVDLSCVRPIGVTLAQFYQLVSINRGENAPRTYWMRPPTGVFPEALRRVARKDLLEFARESHWKMMQ